MGPLEGNRTLPHRPSSLILPRSQLGFFARSTEPRNTLLLFFLFYFTRIERLHSTGSACLYSCRSEGRLTLAFLAGGVAHLTDLFRDMT